MRKKMKLEFCGFVSPTSLRCAVDYVEPLRNEAIRQAIQIKDNLNTTLHNIDAAMSAFRKTASVFAQRLEPIKKFADAALPSLCEACNQIVCHLGHEAAYVILFQIVQQCIAQ